MLEQGVMLSCGHVLVPAVGTSVASCMEQQNMPRSLIGTTNYLDRYNQLPKCINGSSFSY